MNIPKRYPICPYTYNYIKESHICRTKECLEIKATGSTVCYGCLDKKQLLTENPETD